MGDKSCLLIYIIAGEPSGDALGGRLMAALRDESTEKIKFIGVGGENMTEQGLQSLFPMSELTLLGIFEIIPKIYNVLKRMKQITIDIEANQPDVVITIDIPSFAFRLGKLLRKTTIIPHIHYVAPTVWAWRPRRAGSIAKFLSHLLVLFPFEPPYFEKHGLATSFVGHSVVENIATTEILLGRANELRNRLNISKNAIVLTILLGSRTAEIKSLAPIFAQVINILRKIFPSLIVLLPTITVVKAQVENEIKKWSLDDVFIIDSDDKFAAMTASSAALAASGSVALELALTKTPMVIAYKPNFFSGLLIRAMAKTKFANLINIMEKRLIIPEFLFGKCRPNNIAASISTILRNEDNIIITQQQAMERVMLSLGLGQEPPSHRAAKAVLAVIKKHGIACSLVVISDGDQLDTVDKG